MYSPIKTHTLWLTRQVPYGPIPLLFLLISFVVLFSCTSSTESVPPEEKEPARLAMAVTDVSIGKNRMAFGIIRPKDGPVSGGNVTLTTYYLDGDSEHIPQETLEATFRQWPVNQSGVYTTEADFPYSGKWGLVAKVQEGSQSYSASGYIEVKNKFSAPKVGDYSPMSQTKTISNKNDIESITSDPNPYLPIYDLTIAEAVSSGMPSVIVFATPAFCKTSTCGPQVDAIKSLHQNMSTYINFIHVEIFDNPNEIKGDMDRAMVSPEVRKWNLPSEPWTFIINREGIITNRFEGFTTEEELKESLEIYLD